MKVLFCKKQILSMFLVIVLAIGMIPSSTFAAIATNTQTNGGSSILENSGLPENNMNQNSTPEGGELASPDATETVNVAKIGDTEYATLKAAMTEANKAAGEYTITLLGNCAEVFTFAQKSGVKITIDGDGNTFSGKITLNAGAGNLTFTDMTVSPANSQTIYLNASTAPNVTFDGCTLKGANKSGTIVYGYASATSNALTIKNCTADNLQYIVSHRQTGSSSVLIENVTATNMIYLARTLKCPNVTIKNVTCDAVIGIDIKNDAAGGKLTLENVKINIVIHNGSLYAPVSGSGAGASWTVELKGVNTFSANGVAYEDTTWFDGNTGYKTDIEAQNGTKFGDLVSIATNAKPGDTIKLLADYTGDAITLPKGVELDANGFNAGDITEVPIVYVAQIGDNKYETLSEAFAAVRSDNDTVTILTDVTENLTGAYLRGNIVGNATITLTNSDWVYCPYTFVIGEGITLNVPALFYYAGGSVIRGDVVTDVYYQRYAGTKLTIEAPGSLTVTSETFIIRYMDGDPDAGIYIVGDNDDSTVELNLVVAYFYQGMINAKDATIKCGTYWQTNEIDGQGSANLVLDNSKLTVTVYENAAKATGNSTVTLKNGSVMNCQNGGFAYDDNAELSVDDTSSIIDKNGDAIKIPLSGSGTEANPYIINSVKDLILFRDSVNAGETTYNAPGVYVTLGANIDLGGSAWRYINTFYGKFDGKGHTISNFTIDATAGHAAFFYKTASKDGVTPASIENLILSNITATVGKNCRVAALVVSYNKTDIKNVTVKNFTVTTTGASAWIAGLACAGTVNSEVTMSNCTVENFTVTDEYGAQFISGISAVLQRNGSEADGTNVLDNLHVKNFKIVVTGIVANGSSTAVGGLIGQTQTVWLNPHFKNCSVTDLDVTATGRVDVGGFMAHPGSWTYTTNCTVAGKIDVTRVTSSSNYAGGFYGDFGWGDNVGKGDHIATNCSADVDIITNVATAGGFVGSGINTENRNKKITLNNCKAEGAVTCVEGGTATIGGFAGNADRGIYNACSAPEGLPFIGKVLEGTNTEVTCVASVGNTYYATLADAIKATQTGDTIKLLADYTGEAITLPKGVKLDPNGFNAGDITEVPIVYVVQIGDNKYETFEEAIPNIKKNSYIKLLADIEYGKFTLPSQAGVITIDLNGHDLTFNQTVTVSHHTQLVVKDDSSNGKKGTLRHEYDPNPFAIAQSSSLDIKEGVNFEGSVQLAPAVAGQYNYFKIDGKNIIGLGVDTKDVDALFVANTAVRVKITEDLSLLKFTIGKVTLTENFAISEGQNITISSGCSLTIPEGVTLTLNEGAVLANNGTINGEGTIKVTTLEQFQVALESDIKNIEIAGVIDAGDYVVDLNGKTLKGTVLGTVSVNNGLWITAEGLKLIGTGAEYYTTTNAVVNVSATELTLISGKVTLAKSWRTLPGQNITVGANAIFEIPAGKTFTIYDNTSVVVEGTLTVNGKILLNKGATLKAPEGLNVASGVDGCIVQYKNGIYTIDIPLVEVNDIKYSCLVEAFEAAKRGGTVKLISDIEYGKNNVPFKFPAGGGAITIDLNGYNFTFYYTAAIQFNTQITVIDSSNGNGMLKHAYDANPFVIAQSSSLDIREGVNFEGSVQLAPAKENQANYFMINGEKILGLGIDTDETDDKFKVEALFVTDALVRVRINDDLSMLNFTIGKVTLTENFAISEGHNITIGSGCGLTIPAGVTLTLAEGATLTNNGTINGDGTIKVATLDQLKVALASDIKNIEIAGVIDAGDYVVDLNGKTLKGTVLGTVSVNNGLWITAEGLKLIGTDAEYYTTTDAVVNVSATELTVLDGTVTLAQSWRTLPGQNITVATDAHFVVPADMTFTIYDNTSVTVNGTLEVNGEIILNVGATLKAPEGLTVTTTKDGYSVKYEDGKYFVKADMVAIGNETYASLTEALAAAKTNDTITFLNNIEENVTINKAVTIDGNGKQYTGTMTVGAYEITIQNVKFVNGEIVKTTTPISGTFRINNCTFEGETTSGYAIKIGYASLIEINGCESKGNSFLYVPYSLTNLSVSNTTIENANWAMHLVSINSPVFTNVTIKNSNCGIVIQNTGNKEITIDGCTFTNTVKPIVIWEKQTNNVKFTFKGNTDLGTNGNVWAIANNNYVSDPGSQYADLVLAVGATLTAPEGLTVTTDAKYSKVEYANGNYFVHEHKITMSMDPANGLGIKFNVDACAGATSAEIIFYVNNELNTIKLDVNADNPVFFNELSAKQMADKFTVTFKDANGNVVTEVETSIAEYATAEINATDNVAYANLLKAMLNYGAAAQKYFAEDINKEYTSTSEYSDCYYLTGATERYLGARVVGDSTLKLQFLFDFRDMADVESTFTVTLGGVAIEPEVVQDEKKPGVYMVSVEIPAYCMSKDVVCTATAGNDTVSITYSVESYAFEAFAFEDYYDRRELVDAMMAYGDAAAEYKK